MSTGISRSWFFVLFTISGFAGLIYESIWTHYLKLFLGHAAYAQTLVLAIFMGGMALGSWICSRYSGNWRNLLLGYAAAEAAIGLCALLFHRVFVAATGLAYDQIIPALGEPLAANAFKWGMATVFILPQSILLGMTFPLMSAGLIRRHPDAGGGTISMLYFTNSLGAAAGVLASGFVLIGLVGLPGTMMTAGLLNIALAVVVWALARNTPIPASAAAERGSMRRPVAGYGIMLMIALLTGAASFIYEIGWIRMLSMVLGSSTHAFELMLSAFILGLACGGLWIKRRIDDTREPEWLLGMIQVVMGALALMTLVVYGHTFEAMQWLLQALNRSEPGYAVFNIGSHLIALAVMFPAAFCAGTTLPLITHALMRRHTGERAIGAVYAANTVGAIVGVLFAVHVGLPHLGLKTLIVTGGAIDIALGLVLLWRGGVRGSRPVLSALAAVAGVAIIAVTAAFVHLEPHKMASGVFRHGGLLNRQGSEILYQRDGKTATVSIVRTPERISIHTNGKSDAAMNPKAGEAPAPDEATMILTAAIPLAILPEARTVANIGLGSGLTSHVFLASDTVREVDTIEIEAAMVEAARWFSPRNDNVYRDSRSRVHVEDAKTYFSLHNKHYDVIASEPSNPWVSGVASLFTEEFYRHVKRHLNQNGVFVQWMQLYEISTPLVASVFEALGRHFSDYAVFMPNDVDMIIVARNGRPIPPLSDAIFRQKRLARELERIKVSSLADLEFHRVGGRKVLHRFFEQYAMPANSDYFPVLDLNAARARFMGGTATEIARLKTAPLPALDMLENVESGSAITPGRRPWLARFAYVQEAMAGRDYLVDGRSEHLERVPRVLRVEFELTRLLAIDCARSGRGLSLPQLVAVADALVPYLKPEDLVDVWGGIRKAPCFQTHEPSVREWIHLLSAISERNAGEIARLAENMLRRKESARRDYVLAAAILGRLMLGDHARAAGLWREYSAVMEPGGLGTLPDLLSAHFRPGAMSVRALERPK